MRTKWILFALFALTAYVADAQKTYRVGDYYNENGKEGIVFWVNETGEHGKIVGMKEAKRRWARKTEQKKWIGANDHADGTKNLAVVKQIPHWKRKYPAFAWCVRQGEGWYLPAIEELKMIKDNEDNINQWLEKYGGEKMCSIDTYPNYLDHWSSTEYMEEENDFFAAYTEDPEGAVTKWSRWTIVRAVAKF